MRTDDSKKPRRATKLQIGALSAVDVPAHSGALAKVMKVRVRKTAAAAAEQEETNKMTDQEKVPEVVPDEAEKAAAAKAEAGAKVEAAGGDDAVKAVVKSAFTAELAHRKADARLDAAFDSLWTMNRALREVTESIYKDDSVTDKDAAFAGALGEYVSALEQVFTGEMAKVQKQAATPAPEPEPTPAAADDEELTTDDGVTVKKSAIGEAGYKLLKAATLAKRAAEDALEMERLQKRAADELGNLTGDNVIKAKLLKCMRAMPQDEREYLDRVLKSANAAAAEGFEAKAIKNADSVSDKPGERLEQLADAYAAEHKVTKAVAVSRVLITDEGRRLYKQLENQEAS